MKESGAKKVASKKPRLAQKANFEFQKAAMVRILKDNIQWADRVKFPAIRTADECAERLNFFFQYCANQGEYPTVEKMYLALGGYPAKVKEWEEKASLGFEVAEMIKTARQILAAVDAEMAVTNNLPQVLYIFRAKNYYGLKDVQTSEKISETPKQVNEKLIAERYNIYDVTAENERETGTKAQKAQKNTRENE